MKQARSRNCVILGGRYPAGEDTGAVMFAARAIIVGISLMILSACGDDDLAGVNVSGEIKLFANIDPPEPAQIWLAIIPANSALEEYACGLAQESDWVVWHEIGIASNRDNFPIRFNRVQSYPKQSPLLVLVLATADLTPAARPTMQAGDLFASDDFIAAPCVDSEGDCFEGNYDVYLALEMTFAGCP